MCKADIDVLSQKIGEYIKEGLLPMVKKRDLKNISKKDAELLVYHGELGKARPATQTELNRISIMIKKGFLPSSYKDKMKDISSQLAKAIIKEGDLNAQANQIAKEENND